MSKAIHPGPHVCKGVGRLLATAIAVGTLGAGTAAAGPADWAASLHAEAMSRSRAYANTGFTKAMVACIRWPESRDGTPEIAFLTSRQTDPGRGQMVPTQRLRMNAMRDCFGRSAGQNCDCAVLDENGRNVLRVPDY